jgi:amidophosphoribosyltransferase
MCGIIGIHGNSKASEEIYQGLLLLQHRGQDGAGILSFDQSSKQFHLYKDNGLVGQIFDQKKIQSLKGEMGIGHNRYSTIAHKSADSTRDLQPMVVNYPHGLALAHNGNLINVQELTTLLREKYHRIMLSKNDAEMLLNLLSQELSENNHVSPLENLSKAAHKIFDEAHGGYSVVGMWANGYLFALRDTHGIRPLVLGEKKLNNGKMAYILSSESHVLTFLGYTFVRDLLPGELLAISPKGEIFSSDETSKPKKSPCMFEWVYFATPESVMEKTSVYEARLNLGRHLGEKINHMIKNGMMKPDVIVPVPESGRIAAIALSESTGIPYRELLIINRYIQRSFILQDQESRKRAVKFKLMAVRDALKGKSVLLVDDSIVRGTTSKRLIETVREAGAREVYFVSTCPPIKHPCYFGIDFPMPEELIATLGSPKEIAKHLNADGVIYQDLEDLKKSLKQDNICTGCLTGEYPFPLKHWDRDFQTERLNFEGISL